MSGLGVLIPIAIGVGLLALAAFFWALRSGQYEDMEGAAQRILEDEGETMRTSVAAAQDSARPRGGDWVER